MGRTHAHTHRTRKMRDKTKSCATLPSPCMPPVVAPNTHVYEVRTSQVEFRLASRNVGDKEHTHTNVKVDLQKFQFRWLCSLRACHTCVPLLAGIIVPPQQPTTNLILQVNVAHFEGSDTKKRDRREGGAARVQGWLRKFQQSETGREE